MTKKKKKNSMNNLKQESNEYVLSSSLSKLNQKRNIPESQTSTDSSISQFRPQNISRDSIKKNENLTNSYFELNNYINSKYEKLNDNIFSVNEKIHTSNETLRTTLELKINDKLDTKYFRWAVGILVAIAGIIYTLSYQRVVSDTESNKTEIINLKNRVNINQPNLYNSYFNSNKNNITEQRKDLDKVESK